MSYTIKALPLFMEQVQELSSQTKKIVGEKLLLLMENPTRYKRLTNKGLVLYRTRFSEQSKEKRLIY